MPALPHCLLWLPRRLCSQMPEPPHCLHLLLMWLCWQMLDHLMACTGFLCSCARRCPPRSIVCTGFFVGWLCSQMPDPPHCLHWLLMWLCSKDARAAALLVSASYAVVLADASFFLFLSCFSPPDLPPSPHSFCPATSALRYCASHGIFFLILHI
jgi:hypothetical protein